MIFQYLALIIIGLAGGTTIAAGVFAFISVLGILPRVLARLNLVIHVYFTETLIAFAGAFGSIITIFPVHLPTCFHGVIASSLLLITQGFFSGIFVGCLAMALAETLKVIPILCRMTKLKRGVSILNLAMALGKAIGGFLQLYLWR